MSRIAEFFTALLPPFDLKEINIKDISGKYTKNTLKIIIHFIDILSHLKINIQLLNSFEDEKILDNSIIAGLILIYGIYLVFVGTKGSKTLCLFPLVSFLIYCEISIFNNQINQKLDFINGYIENKRIKEIIKNYDLYTVLISIIGCGFLSYLYSILRFIVLSLVFLCFWCNFVTEIQHKMIMVVLSIILIAIFHRLIRFFEKVFLSFVYPAIGSMILILYLIFAGFEENVLKDFFKLQIFKLNIDFKQNITIAFILIYLIGVVSNKIEKEK